MRTSYNIIKKVAAPVVINAHDQASFGSLTLTSNCSHAVLFDSFWLLLDVYTSHLATIRDLSFSGETKVTLNAAEAPLGAAVDVPDATCQVYLVIKGLVNPEAEIARVNKKIEATQKQQTQLETKMAGADYKKKVPENVQELDKAKVESLKSEIITLKSALETFKKLM